MPPTNTTTTTSTALSSSSSSSTSTTPPQQPPQQPPPQPPQQPPPPKPPHHHQPTTTTPSLSYSSSSPQNHQKTTTTTTPTTSAAQPLNPPQQPPPPNNDTFLKRFRIIEKIGEGSYSEVVKCKNKESGLLVACKRLKHIYRSWNQVNDIAEVTTLRTLTRHPNILQMLEIHYDTRKGKVSLIFEIMDMNLYELIKDRKKLLPEPTVRVYMFQLLKALRHLHKYGVFHRDIKPENILIKLKNSVLKLGDLGSVRGIFSHPPFTEYISTRWYRSPECLLTAGQYGFKMDVWAAGCVFYEILTLQPLFPGASEIDQINKIHNVMGPPPQKTLKKFVEFAENQKNLYRSKAQQNRWDGMVKILTDCWRSSKVLLPDSRSRNTSSSYDWNNNNTNSKGLGTGLDRKLPSYMSAGAKELIKHMLTYDPDGRPTSQRLLQHSYFDDVRHFKVPESEVSKAPIIAVCGDEFGRVMISHYYGLVDLKTLGDRSSKGAKKTKSSAVVPAAATTTTTSPSPSASLQSTNNNNNTKIPEKLKQQVIIKKNDSSTTSLQDPPKALAKTEPPPNDVVKANSNNPPQRVNPPPQQQQQQKKLSIQRNQQQKLPSKLPLPTTKAINDQSPTHAKLLPQEPDINANTTTATLLPVKPTNSTTTHSNSTPYVKPPPELSPAGKRKFLLKQLQQRSSATQIPPPQVAQALRFQHSHNQNQNNQEAPQSSSTSLLSSSKKSSSFDQQYSQSNFGKKRLFVPPDAPPSSRTIASTTTQQTESRLKLEQIADHLEQGGIKNKKKFPTPLLDKALERLNSNERQVARQEISQLLELDNNSGRSRQQQVDSNNNVLKSSSRFGIRINNHHHESKIPKLSSNSGGIFPTRNRLSGVGSGGPPPNESPSTSSWNNKSNNDVVKKNTSGGGLFRKPPLPPPQGSNKYAGAPPNSHRSSHVPFMPPTTLPPSVVVQSRESKSLTNLVRSENGQDANYNNVESMKRRTERIRAQIKEEVYCSSDDDIVSSMRQKLDILISERARRASDSSYEHSSPSSLLQQQQQQQQQKKAINNANDDDNSTFPRGQKRPPRKILRREHHHHNQQDPFVLRTRQVPPGQSSTAAGGERMSGRNVGTGLEILRKIEQSLTGSNDVAAKKNNNSSPIQLAQFKGKLELEERLLMGIGGGSGGAGGRTRIPFASNNTNSKQRGGGGRRSEEQVVEAETEERMEEDEENHTHQQHQSQLTKRKKDNNGIPVNSSTRRRSYF